MTDRLTPEREAEIADRAAALHEYATVTDYEGQVALEQLTDKDVPALLAELAAVRAELEHLRKSRDAFRDQRNAVFQTNQRLIAEVQESGQARLRAENETRTVKRDRDEARLELSEYEQLNPQQCRAEKHSDWLIDSEHTHACPWCEIELLKQNRAADAIEYGIRIPDGTVLLDGCTTDRHDQEDRLVRYRDSWPAARLVQRSVFHGEWAEMAS